MPFQIIRNDITKIKADAIVNTANPEVMVGPGVGEVAATPAGNLPAKYIFHESSPIWIDGNHNEPEMLRLCYDRCLNLALQHNCESIAFPLLASSAYGFPKDVSLRIAIDAFRSFLSEHELEIYLVVYDDQTKRLSDEMFNGVRSFVDQRYNAARPVNPFMCVAPSISASMAPDFSQTEPAPKPAKGSKKRFNIPSFRRDKSTSSERDDDASIGSVESRQVFSGAVPSQPLETYVDRFENQEILTFGEYLQQLINKKGMTNKEVYFESNLTKQYFSKLINNKVGNPAKEKLLCIAVALKLNIDETKDFLLHAGYAISPYSKIDLVFEYYIRNGIYDVYEISFALEDLGIAGGLWPELA